MTDHPEWQKAQRGELFHAFIPELVAVRDQCKKALDKFNASKYLTRRQTIQLWREITQDPRPLPPEPPSGSQEEDDQLFADEPWVCSPLFADYGVNIVLGEGAFVNANATFIDTCPIRIGARTLLGPGCNFYSGTHPLDPALRNGLKGPEMGKDINIGEDCWLGGNVIVLPGVTIGKGCTIGAGSVVTKEIPAFHVAAGNPARILRKIETVMDPSQHITEAPKKDTEHGAEAVMAEQAP